MSKLHIKTRMSDLYAYRHEPEHVRALASMWWRILLGAALVAIVLIATYAAFEYARATNAAAGSAEVAPGALPSISRDALQRALTDFEARTAQFENLKSGASN
ncbi:MAG: hypothetical protein Q8P23_02060 [bacterium]|nr:hypothetical protein [bacterium]